MSELVESSVRARARVRGYAVRKSRDRSIHSNNHGAYRLLDERNMLVLGDRFDASLDEIATWLDKQATND